MLAPMLLSNQAGGKKIWEKAEGYAPKFRGPD
jgi:hypothetical protein